MNPLQVCRQIKQILEDRTWSVAGGTAVFGNVSITNAPNAAAFEMMVFPVALIRPGNATHDPEYPGQLSQDIEVSIATCIHGDVMGENALIGANRGNAGAGSEGRGLLEVEEELLAAMRVIGNESGIRVVSRSRSAISSLQDDANDQILLRSYSFLAECTDTRYYHPPTRFAAADAGGGQATLTWTNAPTRFDTVEVTVRRAAGATAPADETAGTEVFIGTGTTFTDSPGAGEFSYAIFAGYADTVEGTTSESWSEQEAGTTDTVTVT